jgi:hypothetical protein
MKGSWCSNGFILYCTSDWPAIVLVVNKRAAVKYIMRNFIFCMLLQILMDEIIRDG